MPACPKPMTVAPVLSRNEEYWFIDGSVILIVEGTGFRIHQSILSKHSDVFADMFAIPQPAAVAETIEGCPVVHLPDSLADFTDVIKALYEPFHFDKLPVDADLLTLLTFISGILRFSTKYNIQSLRYKCITILRTRFPSTLTGCDALLSSGYRYVSATVVRAIPLGRETNVPEILPWAFYISTHITVNDLLTDPFLSWKDKSMCLAGKERLWAALVKHTHPFMFEPVKASGCGGICQARLQGQSSLGWREAEEMRSVPHPLGLYDEWSRLKVCGKCTTHAEAQHKAGREKVWEMLPGIFDLGSWDDIHKDQNR